jgi:sugar phosphate isomerase/epimerase
LLRTTQEAVMKIAGHTIATPEYGVMEAIDLFSRLGLEGIEAICHDEYRSAIRTDISAAELRELRQRAEGQGLQFAGITPYATDLNSPDQKVAAAHKELLLRAIEIAHTLGAPTVRTYAGTETGGPGRSERLQRLVEALRRPLQVAAQAGVRLGFENHFNTLADSARASLEVVRAMNHPSAAIVYDQGNLTLLGAEDYREAVPLQATHIAHVHVKDIAFKEKPPETSSDRVDYLPANARRIVSRVIGEGCLPWPEMLAALKRAGFDKWLSLEYERRWYPDQLPPVEIGMKAGADLVRRILKDLG